MAECCGTGCCLTSIVAIFSALYFLINFLVDRSVSTKIRKNVLVTGCDSGFGLATALELSESNCKVFAGCLTTGGVDRLQSDPKFQGMAFIMDVTKNEDVEKAKKIIQNDGGWYCRTFNSKNILLCTIHCIPEEEGMPVVETLWKITFTF